MPTPVTTVLSVNVGRAREFDYNGRPAKSAIWKSPVAGRIAARGVNLEGDDQADRKAHGGPDKSVYAYAREDARWWEEKLGRSLQYGQFGENLTTEGVAVNDALVGERWAIGTAVFEVSEPRIPCWRLGVRMNDQMFPRRFTEALRPGTYLRIIVEGAVGAGDEIGIIERPLPRSDGSRHISHLHSRSRRGRAPARRSSPLGELAAMGATFSPGNEGSARRFGSSWMLLISRMQTRSSANSAVQIRNNSFSTTKGHLCRKKQS